MGYGLRGGGPTLAIADGADPVRISIDEPAGAPGTLEFAEIGPDGALCVSFAPLADGRLLLASTTEDALRVWDGHTLRELHSEPLDFNGSGVDHLDWTMTAEGSLLLAAATRGGQVHVWDAVLEPPAQTAGTVPGAGGARVRSTALAARPARILDEPEEVTPPFTAQVDDRASYRVRCVVAPDGRVLAATEHGTEALQIWNAITGVLLYELTGLTASRGEFAWGRLADGRLVLATRGSPEETVQIWDAATGQLDRTLPLSLPGELTAMGWVRDHGARPLVAVASKSHIRTLDPETGEVISELASSEYSGDPPHLRHPLSLITENSLSDGSRRLVSGVYGGGGVQVWNPDTGALVHRLMAADGQPGANDVWSVAWGHAPDGRWVLAAGTGDGIVRIWDPETGELVRSLSQHSAMVHQVTWVSLPGLPPALVSAGHDGTAWIRDPYAGTELFQLPSTSHYNGAIDQVLTDQGDLLLFIANGPTGADLPDTPFRVWRIATVDVAAAKDETESRAGAATWSNADLTRWLLRLGSGGLWPPLGLVADLVTLTGEASPDPVRLGSTLCDARLTALDVEPGIARLRGLGWAPQARVSFAALLTGSLAIPGQYAPPGDAGPVSTVNRAEHDSQALPGPAELRTALDAALAGRGHQEAAAAAASGPGPLTRPWTAPVADLRAAADQVGEQAIALFAILGPDACAADPLLPLRLAHHIPRLPALSARDLRLLASAGTRSPAAATASTGAMTWAPGSAGVARSGPLTRLLPTELALPGDLLTARLAEDQLLYRQHRAPAPPAPEPVTIILDTTPPAFGPAGTALRLAVHLLTVTLWAHDRYPALITLTEPGSVTEPRSPADLIRIWTSATLADPVAAIATARRTAAGLGQPTVLCANHQTARDAAYVPGPAFRLLTAHQPPERPRAAPASPWHRHLPPDPAEGQLAAAVAGLLEPGPSIGLAAGER